MQGSHVSYDKLVEKVRQAELALEARERAVSADVRQTRATWRRFWTPGRIVAVGAVAGFLYGQVRGKAAAGTAGTGLLRLTSSLVTLVSSLQAKSAADEAESAAHSAQSRAGAAATAPPAPAPADADADAATAAAGAVPRADRRRPDPSWDAPPGAAEAATEISER